MSQHQKEKGGKKRGSDDLLEADIDFSDNKAWQHGPRRTRASRQHPSTEPLPTANQRLVAVAAKLP